MRLRLSVSIDGMYFKGGAAVEIPELMRQEFAPLKVCDEPILSFATGDLLAHSEEVKIVIKKREDSAKILAEELTRLILNEMGKSDTSNGY